MPLFEIDPERQLVPFRLLRGGAELYEREIEELLWENLEEFTGETLFRIARQPRVTQGGKPDVVALDESARVVVVEIKRDVDRGQLAQCLEYAGWARSTSLDELATMYHRGTEAFFGDWQDFTSSTTPTVINRQPRLLLVARDFEGRTESAFEFLIENGLPVAVVRVSVYEDERGRRFLDVEGEREVESFSPETEIGEGRSARIVTKFRGHRVRISDLLEHGLLQVGDELEWNRPRLGMRYNATVAENGSLTLPDGRSFSTPSKAAIRAADIPICDGWTAWEVTRLGVLLNDLRRQLVEEGSAGGDSPDGGEEPHEDGANPDNDERPGEEGGEPQLK